MPAGQRGAVASPTGKPDGKNYIKRLPCLKVKQGWIRNQDRHEIKRRLTLQLKDI